MLTVVTQSKSEISDERVAGCIGAFVKCILRNFLGITDYSVDSLLELRVPSRLPGYGYDCHRSY